MERASVDQLKESQPGMKGLNAHAPEFSLTSCATEEFGRDTTVCDDKGCTYRPLLGRPDRFSSW